MERKFAYYIFLGLLIGAILGIYWSANGNANARIPDGGLAGAGIGWFIAAARTQNQNEKSKTGQQ